MPDRTPWPKSRGVCSSTRSARIGTKRRTPQSSLIASPPCHHINSGNDCHHLNSGNDCHHLPSEKNTLPQKI